MSNTPNSYIDTYFNTYNLLYHNHNINNFNLIKNYPQITTPDAKQSLYKYLKHLIIQNINNITQKQHNNIIEILKDNDLQHLEKYLKTFTSSKVILKIDISNIYSKLSQL